MQPVDPAESVKEIREILQKAGLRCTAARLAVMQRLRTATKPMSHAEIAEELTPLGFDKATVFRNLIDLTEVGLLSRSELGDHVWRFELIDQAHPHQGKHPHFVCVDCGSVTCLDDVVFDAATKQRAETIGEITEILLKGHCTNCT